MGKSLVVQWLRLSASGARDADSIPGWGTKITQAVLCSQENKLKNKKLLPEQNSAYYLEFIFVSV